MKLVRPFEVAINFLVLRHDLVSCGIVNLLTKDAGT